MHAGLVVIHSPSSLILLLIQVNQRQKVTILIITNPIEVLEEVIFDLSPVYGVLVLRKHRYQNQCVIKCAKQY
jgi:hypothetical protein